MEDQSVMRFSGKERLDDMVIPPEIGKLDKHSINSFEGKLFISGDLGFVEFNAKFERTRLTLTKARLLFAGEQQGHQVYLFRKPNSEV